MPKSAKKQKAIKFGPVNTTGGLARQLAKLPPGTRLAETMRIELVEDYAGRDVACISEWPE